jgi:hypothetical protein
MPSRRAVLTRPTVTLKLSHTTTLLSTAHPFLPLSSGRCCLYIRACMSLRIRFNDPIDKIVQALQLKFITRAPASCIVNCWSHLHPAALPSAFLKVLRCITTGTAPCPLAIDAQHAPSLNLRVHSKIVTKWRAPAVSKFST